MTIKLGRDKIVRLITSAIEKHDLDTGKEISRNQTITNYSSLANQLTANSSRLPELCPENFQPDTGGKYLITPAQVRDAYFGKVDSLKDHFHEACYLFLYNKLSRDCIDEVQAPDKARQTEEPAPLVIPPHPSTKRYLPLLLLSIVLFVLLLFVGFKWYKVNQRLSTLTHDMKILPYVPTASEIAALEGIWKIYTGSPQARKWDSNRCNMTVPNMMEIRYKDGYFVFNRYGPAFNQDGFMQLEAPGIVSIHSRVLNDSGNMVAPKHSLMVLEKGRTQLNAISASWNFDADSNKVIGIREVYLKKGNGTLAELKNSLYGTQVDRVLQWTKPDQRKEIINLKNQRLEDLDEKDIGVLLNKSSIVLKDPDPSLLLDCPQEK